MHINLGRVHCSERKIICQREIVHNNFQSSQWWASRQVHFKARLMIWACFAATGPGQLVVLSIP